MQMLRDPLRPGHFLGVELPALRGTPFFMPPEVWVAGRPEAQVGGREGRGGGSDQTGLGVCAAHPVLPSLALVCVGAWLMASGHQATSMHQATEFQAYKRVRAPHSWTE